jgi:hypothetical protein
MRTFVETCKYHYRKPIKWPLGGLQIEATLPVAAVPLVAVVEVEHEVAGEVQTRVEMCVIDADKQDIMLIAVLLVDSRVGCLDVPLILYPISTP